MDRLLTDEEIHMVYASKYCYWDEFGQKVAKAQDAKTYSEDMKAGEMSE